MAGHVCPAKSVSAGADHAGWARGTERLHCGCQKPTGPPGRAFRGRYLVHVDVPLTLAEELLLLTGDTGDQPLAWTLHYGVAGALLAEL